MAEPKTLTPLLPRDFLGRTFADFLRWPMFPLLGMTKDYPMRLEEFTEDGHLVVRAELPGLDPDKDIDITVADGLLTIRGERHTETKREEKGGYYTEMQYGSFSRTIPLPEGAGEQDVVAKYENGILEVRLPVAKAVPAKQPTRIPVSH